MKRIFIFLLISVLLLLRFSLSIRRVEFHENEVQHLVLDLNESHANILKINDKYPSKHIYAKLFYKENGKYEGYFLIKNLSEEDNFIFMELEEIKSKKIEKNFIAQYLDKIFDRAQDNFSPDIKNINKALLLGDSSKISKKMKEKIRYLGLSHIFAMSGLHIGIIYSFFYFICYKIFNKKIIIESATLILISLYYLGIKESPSFTRAYLMIFIFLLAKILYEKIDIKKTLFLSAIISFIFKPNVIFSVSFQLSYLAMLAIIYFFPLIRKINIKKLKVLDYIFFTLSIQIFLIPIQIFYFNTFPFLAIPINILILPFAGFYIILIYFHLFLENFYLSFILTPIVELYHLIFQKIIDIFSEIPNSIIYYYNKKLIFLYLIFFIYIFIKDLIKKK
ncbi:MAG: ComEC/Rec2 family competence protein [Fusobacterium sp.]|nr:ComEC/Rec2 family competence protein [Fusobacterium sp.]